MRKNSSGNELPERARKNSSGDEKRMHKNSASEPAPPAELLVANSHENKNGSAAAEELPPRTRRVSYSEQTRVAVVPQRTRTPSVGDKSPVRNTTEKRQRTKSGSHSSGDEYRWREEPVETPRQPITRSRRISTGRQSFESLVPQRKG